MLNIWFFALFVLGVIEFNLRKQLNGTNMIGTEGKLVSQTNFHNPFTTGPDSATVSISPAHAQIRSAPIV
jgi:hypothetical protein